jgi:hypothetical protein
MAHWRNHKTRIFREINNDGYKTTFEAPGYEHFMKCFKPAWGIAFTKDLNMIGWRVEGMIPFTRHALWRKVEECRLMDNSFSLSASLGSLPHSLPSSPLDPSPSPDDLQATPPLAPSAILPPPPPLRNTPFPVGVLEAHDYMQSIAPITSGILDIQAVLMKNARRVEDARVIGDGGRRAPWKITPTTRPKKSQA